jgi:hypothetical protein
MRYTAGMVVSGALHRAWWSTLLIFLIQGCGVSTWISRIPSIKTNLALNNGVLGLTLLGAAVGSVISIPLTGILVTRYGSKRVTTFSMIGFCLALVPLAIAGDAITLGLALVLFGAFAGMMDVAMNAQGVEVEKRLETPTMSRFHGLFSLGGMLGAGAGAAVAAWGIAPVPHFAVAAGALLALAVVTAPHMIETHGGEAQPQAHRVPLSKMPKVLFTLSAIAFCILLSEGAMADWTGVYLRQVLDAGPGTAAAGYAVFSAAMALFRLLGDMITLRLGSVGTVRTGGLVAAAGLLCALCAPSPAWAMPGFAATGAGFSVIVPLVFGAGGRVQGVSPGAGIATVTGLGYFGFLVGPPTIGFTSQVLTLRYALGIVVLLCLLTAKLSSSVANPIPQQAAA